MGSQLTLELDFERVPSADELGEIFSALAHDYREMTNGRTLAVVRMASGSIIVTLTDAALAAAPYVLTGVGSGLLVITAINELAEFAENLKKWFGYAKVDKEKKRFYRRGRKSPGQRSVEAIIKIAATTRSHVRVKYDPEKGEPLEAELTPTEAIAVRELAPKQIKKVRSGQIPPSAPDVQLAIERLQQIDAKALSPTDIHAIVGAIVAVLQGAGVSYVLPGIASELEANGLHDIAYAVRQHIHPSSGTHEPPLTSS